MPVYLCKAGNICGAYLKERGYCEKHRHLAKTTANPTKFYDLHLRDQESKAFYNSAAWKRCRAEKIAANPICERCRKTFTAHVHHHQSIKVAPEKRLDPTNLMSVCISCHNAVEAELKRDAPGV